VYTGKIEGCPVILIRPDWNESNLFRGGRIYGGEAELNLVQAYIAGFCHGAYVCCLGLPLFPLSHEVPSLPIPTL